MTMDSHVLYSGTRRACLAAVLALSVAGCGTGGIPKSAPADAFARIRANHLMRVGYVDWAPCISRQGKDGPLQGIYVDMVNEIASKLGVQVTWVEVNLSNFTTELNTGKIDFSVGPTVLTIPRAAAISFTIPIDWVGNIAVVPAKSSMNLRTLADINQPKVRVAVLQGQVMDEFAKTMLTKAQIVRLSGGDLTAPLAAVGSGQADIGFMNTVTVQAYAKAHPEVKALLPDGKEMEVLPHAWATRPEDGRLREFLNASIEYLTASGRVAAYQDKQPLKVKFAPPPVE